MTSVSDSTMLVLRPFRATAEPNGRYRITRRGCDKSILVREVGYRACCLLRRPLQVSELRAMLSSTLSVRAEAIDLTQLFNALKAADLVRSLDGRRLPEKNPPGLRSMLRYWYKWHFVAWMQQQASRFTPHKARCRSLAYCFTYLSTGLNYGLKAEKATRNFAACTTSQMSIKPHRLKRYVFKQKYIHHLTKNSLDFYSLLSMSPAEAETWMAKHVTYSGLEHLVEAGSRGRGVIVSAFHFNVTKVIPFLLMRKGFTVTQVAVPDASVNVSAFAEWVTSLSAAHSGFGEYKILSSFGVEGFSNLADLLGRGGIAVWLPDIYFDKSASLSERERSEARHAVEQKAKFLGIQLFDVQLPRSRFATEFMGQQILMNGWAGAFAATTGSAVVPAALHRQGNQLQLSLYPPLFADAAKPKAAAEQVNRALFSMLDSLVRSNPEQWFGWHSLVFANGEQGVGL